MDTLLIEAHFFPSIEYFCALHPYPTVQLEAHEHYVKQSFRNRCYIRAVHGVERLTVPLTAKHGKVPVRSVQVNNTNRWSANLWRTLQSAYANSPYFEFYRDDIHRAIFSGERYLFDLNRQILSMCLSWLNWSKVVTVSEAYREETPFTDLRNVISAKHAFGERTIFRPLPYVQVFGSTFVPNLSILDLVCCAGPEAGRIIAGSACGTVNK